MDMLAPVVLLVTFRIDSDQIAIKYTVENKSGAEIYLVNHLTRYENNKGWLPDAKVVYTTMDEQGIIEIAKQVPREPPNRLVTPRDYYVTPLAAGHRFEEELTLAVPLLEHRPYDSLIQPIPEAKEVDTVIVFSLGYFESHPSIEAKKTVVHGIPTYELTSRPLPAGEKGSPASEPTSPGHAVSTAPTEKMLSFELGKVRLSVVSLPKK